MITRIATTTTPFMTTATMRRTIMVSLLLLLLFCCNNNNLAFVNALHHRSKKETIKLYFDDNNNNSNGNANVNNNNNIAITRILERIDMFMNTTSQACIRVMTLRNMNYFTTKRSGNDNHHDPYHMIFDLLYTTATKDQVTTIMGYEDGTYYDIGDDKISALYREPGFNGYNDNNDITEGDDNYKHWISCINNTNGKSEPCIMPENTSYATCRNNQCEYTPCSRNITTSDYFIKNMMIDPVDNIDYNMTIPTYCMNYEIMTVSIVETSLGYIPRTRFCLNRYGKKQEGMTQVMKTNDGIRQTLGSCTYQDGMTLVNRSHLFGNYATCRTNNSLWSISRVLVPSELETITNNSDDAVCLAANSTTGNTTSNNQHNNDRTNNIGCYGAFYGGFASEAFDHRTRSWYISSRQNQNILWTQPYQRYQSNLMSIMYTVPIYNIINNANNNNNIEQNYNYQNQRVQQQQQQPYTYMNLQDVISTIDTKRNNNSNMFTYAGMIGARFDLHQIDDYLTEQFSRYRHIMKVFIIETVEPYYVIATTLNSSTYGVVRYYYNRDPSTLCPTEYKYDITMCHVKRVSIRDFRYNEDSNIFYQGFMEHFDHDMAYMYLYFQEQPGIFGSKAFVAQRILYQHTNLQWNVFVIFPMDDSNSDSIQSTENYSAYIAIILIATIGFISCLGMFIIFYRKRKDRRTKYADYRLTCLFLFGCATINLSSYTLLGSNQDAMCMLRMWSFHTLFFCALSPLLVKLWRMQQMLKYMKPCDHEIQEHSCNNNHDNNNNNEEFNMEWEHKRKLTTLQAWLYVFPLIFIEMIILTIFSLIDPPRETETLGYGNTDVFFGEQHIACETETDAFWITQVTYTALLLLIGCVIAFRIRDLDPKFGETKQVAFSIYNIAITGIVIICLVQFVTSLNNVSQAVLQAIGVLWGSFFSCLAISLTRILELKKELEDRLSGIQSTEASTNNSK